MNAERRMVLQLPGPLLVLGASGFVGANLLRRLLAARDDVHGTVFRGSAWRLFDISTQNLHFLNVLDPTGVQDVLQRIGPAVVFDCTAYGGYSFQNDRERIYRTGFLARVNLLSAFDDSAIKAYVHAGSSSEYGLNSAGPSEDAQQTPNSHYAVAKSAAASLLRYFGKVHGLPCVNLRLYSVYGPYEDSSRLVPTLVERARAGHLPALVSADTARDFIHVDDVCSAFVLAAARMRPEHYGESYNIGTGRKTTIRDIATLTCELFDVREQPSFGEMPARSWDLDDWYADPSMAEKAFGWSANVALADGLRSTAAWWSEFLETHSFAELTAREPAAGAKHSVSAIVACYKDEQAIPIMYQRLVEVFTRLNVDYEIIFVNDCSPDESGRTIEALSQGDARVLGINHARNFGSQAAFRSGMEMASREACVLLDGDLQDPPELIEQFVQKWREGFDVVYGRRVKREMAPLQGSLYKGFYFIFKTLSYIPIPRDAGDFSLIDRRVVYWLLQCPERDAFLRGLRAYVGFRQTGVDFERPERMFGSSTNSFLRNLGWAKKGIFSFSNVPLNVLMLSGVSLLALTALLSLVTVIAKLLMPELAPRGITTLLLAVMFFGSINLFGLALLGEYVGKIMTEVKGRPQFIRASLISGGRTHDLSGLDG